MPRTPTATILISECPTDHSKCRITMVLKSSNSPILPPFLKIGKPWPGFGPGTFAFCGQLKEYKHRRKKREKRIRDSYSMLVNRMIDIEREMLHLLGRYPRARSVILLVIFIVLTGFLLVRVPKCAQTNYTPGFFFIYIRTSILRCCAVIVFNKICTIITKVPSMQVCIFEVLDLKAYKEKTK